MRRSKLKMQVDVLKIFASQGPKKLTQLMHRTDLCVRVLKQHLDFLIQQNLVEEQNLGEDKIFYVITGRGLKVLNIIIPVIEETHEISSLPSQA